MTAVDNTPGNKNFLSPLNFKFTIKRAPHTNFFIQRANIPSIKLPQIDTPNPFVKIPEPATSLEYGRLEISFKVDEDLQNYLEIHNWIRAIGKPDNFGEHLAISSVPEYTGGGIHSELSLIILNSARKANFEFTFRNAFPTSLSDLQFETTDTTVDYLTAHAEFTYIMFDIAKI